MNPTPFVTPYSGEYPLSNGEDTRAYRPISIKALFPVPMDPLQTLKGFDNKLKIRETTGKK